MRNASLRTFFQHEAVYLESPNNLKKIIFSKNDFRIDEFDTLDLSTTGQIKELQMTDNGKLKVIGSISTVTYDLINRYTEHKLTDTLQPVFGELGLPKSITNIVAQYGFFEPFNPFEPIFNGNSRLPQELELKIIEYVNQLKISIRETENEKDRNQLSEKLRAVEELALLLQSNPIKPLTECVEIISKNHAKVLDGFFNGALFNSLKKIFNEIKEYDLKNRCGNKKS